MNKTDLIEYIKTHCLKENNRLNSIWYRYITDDIKTHLIQYTNFLTNNPPIQVRIYALLDGLTQQTTCKQCGIDLKYQSKKGNLWYRFDEYCALHKSIITWKKNLGVDNPSKCNIIKDKKRKTCIKNFGVDVPAKSQIVKDKMNATNMLRYGGNPSGCEIIKDKKRKTCIKNFGVDIPAKSPAIVEKQIKAYKNTVYNNKMEILTLLEDYDYMYDQYVNQNKTSKQIGNELSVCAKTVLNYLIIHKIDRNTGYQYSVSEIAWLDLESEKIKKPIQHVKNGNQYKIPGTNFRVDGYCEETNTVYEFYGDYFHGNPSLFDHDKQFSTDFTFGDLYNKTMEREKIIKDLGYNLITMWESDFNKKI
jgi:hypothetical protein